MTLVTIFNWEGIVMKRLIVGLVVVVLLASASVATADIELDFSSLPSTQGWTYHATGGGSGFAESDLFSVGGGVLHQDTMVIGFPAGTSGLNFCEYTGIVADTFTIQIRARVTDYAQDASRIAYAWPLNVNYPFGLSFGITGPGGQATVGISSTNIGYVSGSLGELVVSDIDNTGYHDYLLVGSVASGGTFSIYRDNVFLASRGLCADRGVLPNNTLFLGDGTGIANAVADITRFSYTDSVVPEPSTLVLLCIGAIVGVAGGWWRGRKAA